MFSEVCEEQKDWSQMKVLNRLKSFTVCRTVWPDLWAATLRRAWDLCDLNVTHSLFSCIHYFAFQSLHSTQLMLCFFLFPPQVCLKSYFLFSPVTCTVSVQFSLKPKGKSLCINITDIFNMHTNNQLGCVLYSLCQNQATDGSQTCSTFWQSYF